MLINQLLRLLSDRGNACYLLEVVPAVTSTYDVPVLDGEAVVIRPVGGSGGSGRGAFVVVLVEALAVVHLHLGHPVLQRTKGVRGSL